MSSVMFFNFYLVLKWSGSWTRRSSKVRSSRTFPFCNDVLLGKCHLFKIHSARSEHLAPVQELLF